MLYAMLMHKHIVFSARISMKRKFLKRLLILSACERECSCAQDELSIIHSNAPNFLIASLHP